jgi:hypothetical protein
MLASLGSRVVAAVCGARRRSKPPGTDLAIVLALIAAVRLPACGWQEPGTQDRPGASADASGADSPRDRIDGRLSMRYVGRFAGSTSDHKLYTTLSADIGDPREDEATFHFMGRMVANLERGDAEFADLLDTWNGDVVGFLYDAFVDLHGHQGMRRVRLGRQWLAETPVQVFLDGIHLETDPVGDVDLVFGAFGGSSARLYESSQQGDWAAGVYAEARPWAQSRLRLDYLYLEDEPRFGATENDLLGARIWQGLGDGLRAEAAFTRLDDRDRDVQARLIHADADGDWLARLSFYQLLETQLDLVNELDPYYNALLELYPYAQFGAMVSKAVGDRVTMDLGADLRRVQDDADVGQFNRDYERGYANLRIDDLIWEGLSVSVMGDVWYSDGRDVRSFGFDASRPLWSGWSGSVGSYYSLYKYDMFTNTERDDVRTYYLRVGQEVRDGLSFDLGYELENNDIDDFHTLRLRGVWRF